MGRSIWIERKVSPCQKKIYKKLKQKLVCITILASGSLSIDPRLDRKRSHINHHPRASLYPLPHSSRNQVEACQDRNQKQDDSSILEVCLRNKARFNQITGHIQSGFSLDPLLVRLSRNARILRSIRHKGSHKQLGLLALKSSNPIMQLRVFLIQLPNPLFVSVPFSLGRWQNIILLKTESPIR